MSSLKVHLSAMRFSASAVPQIDVRSSEIQGKECCASHFSKSGFYRIPTV